MLVKSSLLFEVWGFHVRHVLFSLGEILVKKKKKEAKNLVGRVVFAVLSF